MRALRHYLIETSLFWNKAIGIIIFCKHLVCLRFIRSENNEIEKGCIHVISNASVKCSHC